MKVCELRIVVWFLADEVDSCWPFGSFKSSRHVRLHFVQHVVVLDVKRWNDCSKLGIRT